MRILTISYNHSTDTTTAKLTREFRNKKPKTIHDLDALRDAVHEVTEIYNNELCLFRKGKDNA